MSEPSQHPTDVRLRVNHDDIVNELGYLAARGYKIRAVKLYRAVYDVGLTEAKFIIDQAAAEAKQRYLM